MEIGETLLVHSAAEWRAWLALHHAEKKEIWLVYYKKTSGKTGITYEESVEQALCFGWIDGAIKGIDAETYAGRFTPRRSKSPWSESNRARIARLLRDGRMTEAGIAVLPDDLRADNTPQMSHEDCKDRRICISLCYTDFAINRPIPTEEIKRE